MKEKVIKTPEEFAQLTSAEICKLIRENDNYCIVGYTKGVDRRIILKSKIRL